MQPTEAEALESASGHYGREVTVAKDARDWLEQFGTSGQICIWRDEDVLDTWFSSALWPFSTLGWPDETPELTRYYPTSTLVTGFDIIFFWVARMMMMGLHFTGKAPFRDVYIHALVRDEKGAKMSKSKGNVIDPLALIDEYGADALRFTLAAMAAQGRDIKLSPARVEGYRNFATKLWNAARFAEHYDCARVDGFDPANATETLNRWIATETTRAAAEVTAAIEAYKFNDAAAALYRFVWNLTCDWYLELIKPVLTGEDGPAKEETRATVAWVLDRIVGLLHPFMPFITEELWARDGEGTRPPLALSEWPALSFADPCGGRRDQLADRVHHGGPLGPLGDERAGRRDGAHFGVGRDLPDRRPPRGARRRDPQARPRRKDHARPCAAQGRRPDRPRRGDRVAGPLRDHRSRRGTRPPRQGTREGRQGDRQDRRQARQRAVHGEGARKRSSRSSASGVPTPRRSAARSRRRSAG